MVKAVDAWVRSTFGNVFFNGYAQIGKKWISEQSNSPVSNQQYAHRVGTAKRQLNYILYKVWRKTLL